MCIEDRASESSVQRRKMKPLTLKVVMLTAQAVT